MGLPIFYINLDSRPERRQFMEHQFAQIGLRATRVSARTPSAEPLIARPHPAMAGRQFRRTEMAVIRSHEVVWRMILDSGADAAIVLEDDAILSRDILRLTSEAIKVFPLIHLETRLDTLRLGRPRQVCGLVGRRLLDPTQGTAAYLIGPAAIRYLLRSPFFAALPIDLLMFHGPSLYDLKIGKITPALAVQDDILNADPTTGPSSVQLGTSDAARLSYPVWRRYAERAMSLPRFGLDLLWWHHGSVVPMSDA